MKDTASHGAQGSVSKIKDQTTRKKFLINPEFQMTAVMYGFILGISIILLIYAANTYFFHELYRTGNLFHFPVGHLYYRLIAEQETFMNRVFLYVAVLVVFGTSVFGMIFSHRIAGPIDRVCKYLETLTDGADEKETKLRFRKKDYFPELARALNQYLASPGKKKKTASK